MKRLVLFPLIVLAGCVHNSTKEQEPKVAGIHVDQSSYNASAVKDSLMVEEQSRHGEWMVKTYYALKKLGYNYKKTWSYIDSATKSIYRDSVPHWYQVLKYQTDSSIRDKKLYRRVPIM